MKIKSMALLLIVVSSFMLLLSPLSSVPTTLAQQEKVLEQGVGSANNQVDKTIGGSPCAIPPAEEAKKQGVEEALKRFRQENVEASGMPGSITIYVYFHVISQGSGFANGDIPEYMVDNQLKVLNDSFSGITGGANTSFRFVKAYAAIRTNRPDWHRMGYNSSAENQAKSELHRGGANALNFYIIGDNNTPQQQVPYGFARFPWEYADVPCRDGVVVPFSMLPGGYNAPFNQGDIGVHEVGHWLGLWHTFEGGCSIPNDYVDDTPAHTHFYSGCPTGRNSCPEPGFDPIDNFMQDASDTCKYRFTNGQSTRMDNAYATYRQSGPPVPMICMTPLFLTQLPTNLTLSGAGATWEQATQFSSSINGKITHIRFYKSPNESGLHVGRIWSDTGELLREPVLFDPFYESPSGWQEQALVPPLSITAGVKYRVSYNLNYYGVKTFAGLNTPITNGPLTAHTSYYSTPSGNFPTTNSGSILFADVRFVSSQ